MSTVFAGPPFVIDGPIPKPPPHRLIDVATFIPLADSEHWRVGAQVWAYPPDLPENFNPCSSGSDRIKAEGGTIPIGEFGAFTAYVAETCTTRSILSADDSDKAWRDRARATFLASESYAVEREFALGVAFPDNPYLTDSNLDMLNATAEPAPLALARLENAIGETGRAGLIHVDPGTAAIFGSQHLVEQRGVPGDPTSSQLWTYRGTRVVVGDGYIGAIPDDLGTDVLADGTAWAFATGPVEFERGEELLIPGSLKEAMDREQNTVTYRVERDYLAVWDTVLQAGVLVDWDPA